MTTDAPSTPGVDDGSRRRLIGLIAIAVLVILVVALVLSGGGDDDDAPTATADEDAATSDDADLDAEAEDDPAEDAQPAEETEAAEEPEPEAEDESTDPEPETVVIGQDEDGNDIVVELEVTGGCAQTFHEPLDENSFSFIRWSYEAPGLEPGVPIRVSNDAGFEFFTVVTPDRRIVVEQGITAYGDYPFPTLDWNESDVSSVTIQPDENHTVDEREGEPSETCLATE